MQIKQHSVKVSVFAFIILIVVGLFIARSTAFSCWDFRNNLWGPAYLLTQNQSPYRVDRLFDLGSAVWMPMAIGLFFPLGFLSLQQASNLWFVFNLVWLLLIIWISSGSRHPSIILFAIVVILSFLFPPTVTHLWSGQISILITLIFLITGISNDRMPAALLALLIAVGLSKPQLAVLVLPGFMIYRLRKYGVRNAVQIILYLIGYVLLLLVPLSLAYPNWFPDFILSLRQNPSWAHPSSLYFLKTAMPGVGVILWSVLVLVIFSVSIWLWTTLPVRDATYWTLAFTPLITPYVWTWDFVLLLPLFISYLFKARTKVSLGILLSGYIGCWSLITIIKLRVTVNDAMFWWVPWMLLATIIASKHLKIKFNLIRNHAHLSAVSGENRKVPIHLSHLGKGR